MTYTIGALIVFGILLAIAIFGYWRASLASDRMDRDRQRMTAFQQDHGTYRS